MNNIINNDSTNTRLGLSVSTNVNNTQITSGRFGTNAPEQLENIPQMQVITPEGTILHGTNPPANESSKRLKLNIFTLNQNKTSQLWNCGIYHSRFPIVLKGLQYH